MKRSLKLITLSFLLSSCSSVPPVDANIKKNAGSTFAYAYMEKGVTLKSISSWKDDTKNNDEIIQLTNNGFLPNYRLLSASCGRGNFKEINVCLSKYTKKTKGTIGEAALSTAIAAGLTAGLSLISERSYQKNVYSTFSPEKLKSIARKNNLIKYRKMLLKFDNDYPKVDYKFSRSELGMAYLGGRTSYLFNLLYLKDNSLIKYAKNPSTKMLLKAIDKNPKTYIAKLKNPSESVLLNIVRKKPSNIQYVKSPSERVQIEAVKNHPSMINYIKSPSAVVKNRPNVVAYKRELQIAEQKRKREEIEYKKNRKQRSYSSSANNSYSSPSSSGYSAPQQRTCTRTVYHTEYAPGRPGITVQVPRNESYTCY